MDIDAYSSAHRDEWDDLERLGRKRRFSGSEADDLIAHYQSGATHLSALRSESGSSVQADRLSLSLSRARMRFTGVGVNVLRQIPTFFGVHLPAALYRIRWSSLVFTLAAVVIAVLYAWWGVSTPGVIEGMGTEEVRRRYAEEDFVGYYSEHGEATFTGLVWTNNAWIAAQCIAFGIVGVWVPYVIFANAQGLGLSAAVMTEQGHLDTFLLYIAPHGQLELYAIFVAAAAGWGIFWAWIAPGPRRRAVALAEEGRALMAVAVGTTLFLLLSGVIEGVVTRADWPWPLKIGIGTVALAVVLGYQWIIGRRAHRSGARGDLERFEAGATQLVAG